MNMIYFKKYTQPVAPSHFIKNVTQVLASKGVVTSARSLVVLRRLCYVLNFANYNQTVTKAKNSIYDSQRVYAFPAQTGIGKSVSLQVYASMLAHTSVKTLIVVSRVEEAINYCKEINQLSGKSSYARCWYTVSKDNPDHAMLAESIYALRYVSCLVVTHALFTKVQDGFPDSVESFIGYGKDGFFRRTNIVVDESINLYRESSFSIKDLQNLNKFIYQQFKAFDVFESDNVMQNVKKTFLALEDYLQHRLDELPSGKKFNRIENFYLHEGLMSRVTRPVRGIEDLKSFVEKAFEEIDKILDRVTHKVNLSSKKSRVKAVEEIVSVYKNTLLNTYCPVDSEGKLNPALKRVTLDKTGEKVFIDDFVDFMLYKPNRQSDQRFFRIQSVPSQFKSVVVLDATAQINAFYKYADQSSANDFVKIEVPQVRKYSNLTINIAKSKEFKQSRSFFYIDKNEDYKQALVDEYLSYAENELKENDKMLLICHKNLRKTFEKKKPLQIEITHWGDHIGKNIWSHCNKVLVAGWNTLNDYAHIASIFNTGNADLDLHKQAAIENKRIIEEFRKTQLADDLVQAVMRSQARIIATQDSDCKPATIYLLHDDTKTSNEVIKLFLSQFPKARVNNWIPTGTPAPKSKGKKQRNADKMIQYLKNNLSNKGSVVTRKQLEGGVKMNQTTLGNNITPYFKELLQKEGIVYEKSNGKEMQFRKE